MAGRLLKSACHLGISLCPVAFSATSGAGFLKAQRTTELGRRHAHATCRSCLNNRNIQWSDRSGQAEDFASVAPIFAKRPDPSYGTGAIVDVAKVDPMPKAAGKWNVYEISAKGPHLTIVLNGQNTADVDDSKHLSGPFALQYGSGVAKFWKVQIKPL
jgi:Domain of Unknown Function (DUF1080)